VLRKTEKLFIILGAIHAPNSAILTKAFKGQLQTETSRAWTCPNFLCNTSSQAV